MTGIESRIEWNGMEWSRSNGVEWKNRVESRIESNGMEWNGIESSSRMSESGMNDIRVELSGMNRLSQRNRVNRVE